MKPSRPLTHDDAQIWQRVARTVRPLSLKPSKLPVDSFGGVHLPRVPSPVLHHVPAEVPTRMDKKTRKGKVQIDKKIDLHDLTRDEAFPVLVRQITRAHKSGARCVLVVTGKGANLEGVLRKSLPAWLMDDSIRARVASFSLAHIRHGGMGAFYVFLKRRTR